MAKRKSKTQSQSVSEDTKLIVTVLTLLLAYPAGIILMWVWTSWPKWVKLVISLPMILLIFFFFSIIGLIAINPAAQLQKAQESVCAKECVTSQYKMICMKECMKKYNPAYPTTNSSPSAY